MTALADLGIDEDALPVAMEIMSLPRSTSCRDFHERTIRIKPIHVHYDLSVPPDARPRSTKSCPS
jgi:hypothetical protein